MRTMKAAVLLGDREIRIEEAQVPEPGAGEVRIRLEGCGVCASNLPIWEGRPWFDYPRRPGEPGHEGWGRIDAAGRGVTGLEEGDRVAVLSYNAFAEYDVAPTTAVVKLPASLDGVPFPAEPIGCAMNVFRRAGVEAGQTVAVIGIGFLGALVTALAADAGARVVAISRRPYSLELARRFGATETITLDDAEPIVKRIEELTGGALCDRVIEAVGKQGPLDLAGRLTRVRGRLVIAGYHQDGARTVDMQLWNWRGIDVINAHEREQAVYIDGMQAGVEALSSGRIDPTPLYTHDFLLEALGDALQMMHDRPEGFAKALIRLD